MNISATGVVADNDVDVPVDPLVARLTPQRDMLLVRRDPRNRQLAAGLYAPDNAGELNTVRAGTVLKAGDDAPYVVGMRIAFYAMTVLQDESDGTRGADDVVTGAIGLVPSTEVLCVFAASEVALPVPLDISGVDVARAPRGCLLVERSTIPTGRGRVLLPGTYLGAVRSLEAVVHSVSVSCALQLAVGTLVLLAATVGRNITFGLRGDRVLSVVAPSQVLCVVGAPLEREVTPSTDIRDYVGVKTSRPPLDAKWDEGDKRAPR